MADSKSDQQREDENLRRLMKMKPEPFTPKKKAKASPKPPKARIQRHQGR